MAPADLANRIGWVINSPHRLKLHAHADVGSVVLAYLPNGTKFRIKGVQREFFHVVIIEGEYRAKFGYLWKERSIDGDYYVELVPPDVPGGEPPSPTADPYPFPWPELRGDRKGWMIGIAIITGLLVTLYACGGGIK